MKFLSFLSYQSLQPGIKYTSVILINLDFLPSYANYYCFKTSEIIFLDITYLSLNIWNLDKNPEIINKVSRELERK